MTQAGEATDLTRRLGRELAAARVSRGLSQADMAAHLGTNKSAAYRVEYGLFQRFSTVADYAAALGYDIEIHLTPAQREESETTA